MSKEKLYNVEIKEKFLNEIENEQSRMVSMYPLRKAAEKEAKLKKDLYEMNLEEIEDVMYNLACSTEMAAYNSAVRLEEYINWAVRNGYKKSNITPFAGIEKVEWSRKFVAAYKRTSFTRKNIIEMCEALANEVDRALLLAIFEGISGEGYWELLNLRTDDIQEINGQYYVTLYDQDIDKEPRTIPISKYLADTLYRADGEKEYISNNGKASKHAPNSIYENSPYVFKKSNRGQQGGRLDRTYISRKFDFYKKTFNLKFMRLKSVLYSGMMHMANELHEQYGHFDQDQIHLVGEHYNTPMIKQGDWEYRNATVIKRRLQSPDFEELYGYKIID